jgi:undecaprenyl-diphosphatase
MSLFQAFVLGVVQGLTEFLPISSSAHLAIVPWLAGWQLEPRAAFLFDVLVQVGTLLPLLVVFRDDLIRMAGALLRALRGRERPWSPDARLGAWVLVATIPAAVIGLLVKDRVEAAFSDLRAVFVFLMFTSLLLFLGERLARRVKALSQLTAVDAVRVGLAQAVALFPGISRSGATMSAGRALGLARPDAARFSFLMAIPALAGAGLIAGMDLFSTRGFADWLLPIAVGFVTSAIVGYVAIRWLLRYLATRTLYPFAVYCLALGVAGLILSALRG